ncbi:MAG: acylneuraminate cytidylyltransferase family protein [Chloroflexi bacterium]|nr:acylneuraminate cytidylyltransferase family protein [Chloroflexota bacterium]
MTTLTTPTIVALIPARAGSKRVQGKNSRPLAGHPLLAYTIAAAQHSGIFSAIILSTDGPEIANIARHYRAEVPFLRPSEYAGDKSPDIEWLRYALHRLKDEGRSFDAFSILRPTSPFRQAETIQRAWAQFLAAEGVDSLRAVEKCKQHPGKMWVIRGNRMTPLLLNPIGVPWHSTPYQALPKVYIQNASLEIAWSRVVFEQDSIAGEILTPFLTSDTEGFDINDEYDWGYAEELIRRGDATLPALAHSPYQAETSS